LAAAAALRWLRGLQRSTGGPAGFGGPIRRHCFDTIDINEQQEKSGAIRPAAADLA
jgi:hypothetical protein